MHDDMWVHAYDRLLVAQVDAIIAWNHLHRTTVQYDICSVTCLYIDTGNCSVVGEAKRREDLIR